MTKTDKADMSCARVKQYTASDVSKAERHNERKNETYENMNVIVERIPFNVHFKKPTAPTYMEQLKQMETDGISMIFLVMTKMFYLAHFVRCGKSSCLVLLLQQ